MKNILLGCYLSNISYYFQLKQLNKERVMLVAKFKIRLNTAKETALFVNVCMHYDCMVDCQVGRIIIDGKSIMGMIDLIGKIVDVKFYCDDERVVNLFKEEIKLWIIE